MIVFVSLCLIVIASLEVALVTLFLVEILASLLPLRTKLYRATRPTIAVLVPAHNEDTGIAATLSDLKKQLTSKDRLIVIADNCTDCTAATAAANGAEVIERHEPAKHGKGFALDFGLRHLDSAPPAVVIIVDADCRVAEDTIERLAKACIESFCPVQADNQMVAPSLSPTRYHVAEFAWRVKNRLRPIGLHNLHLPCQLTGTGMAFPWAILSATKMATSSIVEDLKLGLDLTRAHHPPRFCPTATVTSCFPMSAAAAQAQRTRWEQGHIGLIAAGLPRYLIAGIKGRNLSLVMLAFDLAIPPLSLLALIIVGTITATAVASFTLGMLTMALVISTSSFIILVVAVVLAWFKCGRDVLPTHAILSVISYATGKLSIYRRAAIGRSLSRWNRTDRQ